MTYNDRVLKYLGGTWSSPPKPPRGWEASRQVEVVELKSGARDLALREFTEAHMVLKDPRLCLVLPLWREMFERPPVAVLVLRDPLEVARSLEHRNDFPLSLGLALWRRYVQQSITSVEGLPVFVADYQSILRDPGAAIGELSQFLAEQGVAPSAHEHTEEAVACLRARTQASPLRRGFDPPGRTAAGCRAAGVCGGAPESTWWPCAVECVLASRRTLVGGRLHPALGSRRNGGLRPGGRGERVEVDQALSPVRGHQDAVARDLEWTDAVA